MALESDFLDLMTQTVTVAPYSGQNGSGEASYGSPVSYSARVVGKSRMVRNMTGQEVLSSKTVYLYGASLSFSTKDRVTLPNGNVPQTPPIIAVSQFPDDEGDHHSVLYMQ